MAEQQVVLGLLGQEMGGRRLSGVLVPSGAQKSSPPCGPKAPRGLRQKVGRRECPPSKLPQGAQHAVAGRSSKGAKPTVH